MVDGVSIRISGGANSDGDSSNDSGSGCGSCSS